MAGKIGGTMSAEQEISAEFPFESQFVEVEGSNLHYVEEGSGDPILFLHGNATFSYLWRNIIPHLSGLGRCIALDFIGMGKSDKPDIDYDFFDHSRYVEGFIDKLGLKNITFVIHDWGSALGFHYATRNQDNVKGLAFMEAILLPVPSMDMFPKDFVEMFRGFRTPDVGWDMLVNQHMFVEGVLPHGIIRKLTDEEMNIYREPFVDIDSRKPLWRWPQEIPIAGEPKGVYDALMEFNQKLQEWNIPKLHIWVTPGAIGSPANTKWIQENLTNLKSVNVGEGSHYIQEDHPHEIGTVIADWYKML